MLSFVGTYGRINLLGTTQTVAGLNDALRRAGAVPGDTVVVGSEEFEFA